MNKNLKLIFTAMAVMSLSNLWASDDMLMSISEAHKEILYKQGQITVIHPESEVSLDLVPDCSFKAFVLDNRVEKKITPFVAEQLYRIEKKDLQNSGKDLGIETVSEIFTSLSTMKGTTYYSNSRKKEVVLYKFASYVEETGNQKTIPDFATKNSDGLETYFKVNDASFGDNVYKLNYYQNEKELLITLKNAKSMGVGPIKAIMPNDLLMNYMICDCEDYFLVYLSTDINMQKIGKIRNMISESLLARLTAVYDWFMKQF